jgi:hypothetical protein
MKPRLLAILVFACCGCSLSIAIADPTPFRAVYRADYKGIPVSATGIRELQRTENNEYLFTSSAKSFFASVTEQSLFRWDDHAIPLEYKYIRRGIGKNRNETVAFNWQHNTAGYLDRTHAITPGTLDKLLYQIQLREDLLSASRNSNPWPEMHYQIADRRRIRDFDFRVVGEETVHTDIGEFKTVKAIRVREDAQRKTTLWLTPDFGYLLVRLQQIEGDKDGFELLLKEALFDGKVVQGL